MERTELGTLVVDVVGLRYAEAELEEGEPVELAREPDNPHDPNAIRVLDEAGDGCGYLPREEAAWLAPLLDRGWIELEGEVLPGGSPGYRKPIELAVTLTAKGGRAVLEPPEPPLAPSEAAHAEVLEAWAGGRLDRRRARRLERRLRERGVPLLPETRLLLRLAPRAASRRPPAEPHRAVAAARRALEAVEIGEAIQAGGLTVLPLSLPGGADPVVRPVAGAVEDGTVIVREVDEHGSVPELLVENTGPVPVFLPPGVILVGGKQDRVVARPAVVEPGRTERIAVRCVERGRWHDAERRFRIAAVAPAAVRSRAACRPDGPEHAGQAEVWTEVRHCLASLAVASTTEALVDGIEAARERVRPAVERLDLPEGTCGIAALADGRLLGLELFGGPRLFEAEADRLLEAFALDAALGETGVTLEGASLRRLLERLAAHLAPRRRRGREVELAAGLGGLHAVATVYGQTLLALTVVPEA